jgi:hypothetical protein
MTKSARVCFEVAAKKRLPKERHTTRALEAVVRKMKRKTHSDQSGLINLLDVARKSLDREGTKAKDEDGRGTHDRCLSCELKKKRAC